MKPGLSGYTVVRNALKLDYPVELTIRSLLTVCDEVVCCDSDSTDGTREMLDRWADMDIRLRIVNYPWPDPKGDTFWYVKWMNFAREQLRFSTQLELDADEVLDDRPECLHAVCEAVQDGGARVFDRLNFWRDPRSLIPEGHCCGKFVTRLGPSNLFMPSDEPRHRGECPILDHAIPDPRLRIFHLGFLRRREAFYAKARVVLTAFFNRYDTRLEDAEAEKKELWQSSCDFTHLLLPYRGGYPAGVAEWLRCRGHRM